MTIKLVNRETEGELLLNGRLDTTTAPDADIVFDKVSAQFQIVILNLQDMEYISSAGLRSIKRLHMAMKKKNGELKIKNTNKMVMEVFDMTGFSGLLKFI